MGLDEGALEQVKLPVFGYAWTTNWDAPPIVKWVRIRKVDELFER